MYFHIVKEPFLWKKDRKTARNNTNREILSIEFRPTFFHWREINHVLIICQYDRIVMLDFLWSFLSILFSQCYSFSQRCKESLHDLIARWRDFITLSADRCYGVLIQPEREIRLSRTVHFNGLTVWFCSCWLKELTIISLLP